MAVITVKFFASIREVTGIDMIDIAIEDGESVGVLLKRLVERFGENLRKVLYDFRRKGLREDITLMVNGRNVKVQKGLDTKLNNRDVVFIFTSIAGG